ncbi:hypothetical protein RhiirA4_458203 [Rhizophagus irregularis]|uniref:Uncharacterized protein n=1 Tax=Rhizophagus irregularis TaxID=588596 RepID=A0A2I1GBN1_9GLOM|nr:hypothetical protein RhiirA4_458203 [Rhizophagus irregularis]
MLKENQPRSALITKQNSHTALAEELKCLNQIYMGIYPACKIISGLQNELKESIVIYKPHTIDRWCQRTPWLIRQQYVEKGIVKSDENKKIWDTKFQIASLAMESELTSKELEKRGRQSIHKITQQGFQIAQQGLQKCADAEFVAMNKKGKGSEQKVPPLRAVPPPPFQLS